MTDKRRLKVISGVIGQRRIYGQRGARFEKSFVMAKGAMR